MNKLELREGWVSFLLLLALGLCLAWTLQAAALSEGIWVLQWVVLMGTVVGLALARAKIPGVVAHVAGTIIGIAWGIFLTATLLPGKLPWMDRFENIRLRILDWWQQAVGGGESYDNLMFILFTTLLFWVFAYIAAYSIFRTHWVWGAIIPNGTVVLMNAYYNPKLMPYFISYLLLALLMIVRFTLFEREDEWQRENVRYSPDLIFDFLRDGTVSAVVVIAIAWLIPLTVQDPRDWTVWDVFEDPWQEVQFHWNRVFASLSGGGPPRFSFFSKSMTLGGPVTLDETPVMDVQAVERHYWRALVFDQYTGEGWKNTDPEEIELEANATTPGPMPYIDRAQLVQTVRFYRPGEKMIFAANQVVQVNRLATARLKYLPPVVGPGPALSGASGQLVAEISSMASKLRLRRNQTYEAISLVPKASPARLRRAGNAYPAWVKERYLKLPDSVPTRVRVLAEGIVAPYKNEYDKAVAIERYLRQITYNEAIEAPPEGVDAVDWFLFEKRQGYCDYYSSAMAVMLRAAGIPARVARGYAAGELIPDSNIYKVRELDAHAWPEVYFPSYGWIEFEPTASEPLIARPVNPGEEEDNAEGGAGTDRPGGVGRDLLPEEEEILNASGPYFPLRRAWWQNPVWLMRGLVALAVLAAASLVWLVTQRRRASMSLVTFVFDDMMRYARRLGVPLGAHQTPYECAAALAKAVEEGAQDARTIADFYVRERYGGQPISVYDEMNAMDAWRRLREAIWVYLVLKYLPVRKETAQSLRAAVRSSA